MISPYEIMNAIVNTSDGYGNRCHIARFTRDKPMDHVQQAAGAVFWIRVAADAAKRLHLAHADLNDPAPSVNHIMVAAGHLAGYYADHVNECDALEKTHA